MRTNTFSAQINFIELASNHIEYGSLEKEDIYFQKRPENTILIKYDTDLNDFLTQLKNQLTKNRRKILFFIHGWWESKPNYMAECIEYLQSTFIDNEKSKIGAVVFVTWNASHFSYKAAQKEALRIAPTFRFLLKNVYHFKNEGATSFNLMSHSLGNFILYHALENDEKVFDKLLMSAPDIPIITNNNKLRYSHIENVAHQIILMRHRNDQSLFLSGIVNSEKRLGRIGLPKGYQGKIETKNVDGFNDVKDWKGKLTNHIHYRTSPKTIELALNFFSNDF